MDVCGRYVVDLERVVGKGAWSTVYECRPTSADALSSDAKKLKVVAKAIDKEQLQQITRNDAERVKIVEREVATLQAVPGHSNVIRFLEYLETPSHYVIIFELAPFGDLCELLLNTATQRLPEPVARKYTVEMILALLHCQRHGIVHRDVKPENMLIADGNVLKLTDFGLAKTAPGFASSASAPFASAGGDDRVLQHMFPHRVWAPTTQPQLVRANAEGCDAPLQLSQLPSPLVCEGHEVIGTFRYGAPEMFEAKFTKGAFDTFAADAWSLGVVAYVMLTGSFPFSGSANADEAQTWKMLRETPVALPLTKKQGGHVSSEARDFLNRMLQKSASSRMRLWDALDHPWLSAEVRRQQQLARDAWLLPPRLPMAQAAAGAEATASLLSTPEFANACRQSFPLPPYLQQLRAVIGQLEAEGCTRLAELKSSYNAGVADFYAGASATAMLRQALNTHVEQPRPAAAGPTPAVPSIMTGGTSRAATPTSRSTVTPRLQSPLRAGLRPPPPSPGVSDRLAPASGRASPAPSRTIGSGAAPVPSSASRLASPPAPALGRASPVTRATVVNRGPTPVRTVAPRPASASASATTTTSASARLGIVSSARPPSPAAGPVRRPSPSVGISARSATPPTMHRPVGAAAPTAPGAFAAAAAPIAVTVGDTVIYKGSRGVVRFFGATSFAQGMWTGLEMLEGVDGIHDGTSSVDKKRYFTCPRGRGVFVRPSQLKAAA